MSAFSDEQKMNSKRDKQFEKDSLLIKDHMKDFKKFFGDKGKPSFKIIYSSTISGFKKNDLYEAIKEKENIMFYFETVNGRVFGCFNSKPIPTPEKFGSNPIKDDDGFFVYSLVSYEYISPFSIKLRAVKKERREIFNFDSPRLNYNPTGSVRNLLNSGDTSQSKNEKSNSSKIPANGSSDNLKGDGNVNSVAPSNAKKDKHLRSLYISSEINQSWSLEVYCCFIISDKYVGFGARIGSFYEFVVPPDCVYDDADDRELMNSIMGGDEGKEKRIQKSVFLNSTINDVFVGCHLPKTVELKKMIVSQWSFVKK